MGNTIKRALGKLEAPGDFLQELHLHRFTSLNITSEHALATETLPNHHKDPFDRLLIAQAKLENLTFITHDAYIQAYGISIIAT